MRLVRTFRIFGQVAKAAAVAGLIVGSVAPAAANSKYAGIVVDAKTGKTLYSSSADELRYPASLTKIMTLYIVFEELEAGRLSLNSDLKVSAYASARPPTKLGLKPGSTLKVKDAILGLVTKSANDAAAVIAENIGGSEARFAERMTRTAHQLGMSKTTFRNPHGLPDSRQRTTARDMATLGRAIQERFPKYYSFFQTRSFTYKGRKHGNHNKLLGRVKGVDGIKTGYTNASGFNLVTSVHRDGRYIVAVVLGGTTGRARDAQMVKLINEYLPKASTGPMRASVVASAPVRSAPSLALANAPVPTLKPVDEPEVAEADGAPMVLALAKPDLPGQNEDPAALVTGSIPVPPKLVQSRMSAVFEEVRQTTEVQPVPKQYADANVVSIDGQPLKKGIVPTPAAAPAAMQVASLAPVVPSAPQSKHDLTEDSTTDTVATNDTPDQEPGWQVQIAAAESESGALEMLEKARSKVGKDLHRKAPYTEPVNANGQTLYRARFVGFETKTAALQACKSLKRAKFSCYAIYQ
ncbi:D-alanyl-D-alanine carboxypeptidase [Roseibium litorale]|uniref:D-alanyl-D-alanine carboxypeptidase n=1 Tax=Roseibium litorale TaxID=2803841 RepID=A0ABR9CIH5_9HYPH|nr:D-alanyl-D-alanine carboxypeptidase [Roseibium litorale]MBD8890111.1 D-alanyl-D-alanine carboxypeptidase [Roseibium litorale]